MSKFKGVLIASDLDGTLLNSDHTGISQENLDAIKYFRANGGSFTLATGRPPLSAKYILDLLDLDVPAVLLNGAVIYDSKQAKVLNAYSLSQEALEFTKDITLKFDEVGVEVFTIDDLFMVKEGDVSIQHFKKLNKEVKVTSFEDMDSPDKWFKINYTHHVGTYLAEVENYFKEKFEGKYQSCYSCKTFFEINNLHARKDYGVLKVAEMMGIEKEHIYTIGDNFNDYHMIQNAKYGFAPSNSEEEVKQIAHKVLGSCDESAVAQMINYLDSIY